MSGVEAVAEVRTDAGLIYGRLRLDLPVGTMLYSQATVDTLRAKLEAAADRHAATERDACRQAEQANEWKQAAEDHSRHRQEAVERAEAAEAECALLLQAMRRGVIALARAANWDHVYLGSYEDMSAAIDAAMSRTKEETK